MPRSVAVAGATAAVLLSGAEAWAPHAGVLSSRAGLLASSRDSLVMPLEQRPARVSAPALRMGLGDMFKDAFSNNPNIPTATATGPGSPGWSAPKPRKPSKGTETLQIEPEPEPSPPVASLWQEATDPASGNPYWSLLPSFNPYTFL